MTIESSIWKKKKNCYEIQSSAVSLHKIQKNQICHDILTDITKIKQALHLKALSQSMIYGFNFDKAELLFF